MARFVPSLVVLVSYTRSSSSNSPPPTPPMAVRVSNSKRSELAWHPFDPLPLLQTRGAAPPPSSSPLSLPDPRRRPGDVHKYADPHRQTVRERERERSSAMGGNEGTREIECSSSAISFSMATVAPTVTGPAEKRRRHRSRGGGEEGAVGEKGLGF